MNSWQDFKDFFFPAVQDTEASQSFFTEAQAAAWANGALIEMAEYTHYYDLVQEQNTTSGSPNYAVGSLGTPPFGLWRAEIDDEKIYATSRKDLQQNDRSWQDRTGKPFAYYMDDMTLVPDYFQIGLFEEPNATYVLRTYAYGMPATVGTDADYVHVPEWAVYGVLWYMLAEAFLTEGRRQNLQTSDFYRRLYEDTLERLRVRSYSKTNKTWVVGRGGSDLELDIRYNLPDTIPEPA